LLTENRELSQLPELVVNADAQVFSIKMTAAVSVVTKAKTKLS